MSDVNDTGSVADLIDGIISGNKSHFDFLKNLVEKYVYSRGGYDRGSADELVSDILGSLYSSLREGRFRGNNVPSFCAYVFGATKNTMMYYNRKGKKLTYSNSLLDIQAHQISTISSKYAKRELSDLILETLDERCRVLLELKFTKGWSDQEVANHLSMTKNAVSTAISRCLKKAQNLDFVQELL